MLAIRRRGSRNVFHDLGHENADIEQFKAILAAEIPDAHKEAILGGNMMRLLKM